MSGGALRTYRNARVREEGQRGVRQPRRPGGIWRVDPSTHITLGNHRGSGEFRPRGIRICFRTIHRCPGSQCTFVDARLDWRVAAHLPARRRHDCEPIWPANCATTPIVWSRVQCVLGGVRRSGARSYEKGGGHLLGARVFRDPHDLCDPAWIGEVGRPLDDRLSRGGIDRARCARICRVLGNLR